jgi:hypothetical protein
MRADGIDKAISMNARGSFGYGGGFGRIALGFNRFGFYSKYSGIYAKKFYFGKPYISKMKFYRPTNPQTETQQAWRAVFTAGHDAWTALDPETKEQWRFKALKLHMTGFNKFMSDYLNTHK